MYPPPFLGYVYFIDLGAGYRVAFPLFPWDVEKWSDCVWRDTTGQKYMPIRVPGACPVYSLYDVW